MRDPAREGPVSAPRPPAADRPVAFAPTIRRSGDAVPIDPGALKRLLAARLVADQVTSPYGHIVSIAIAASLLWGIAPHGLLLLWIGAVLASVAVRTGISWMCRSHDSVDAIQPAMRLGGLINAAAWGVGAAVMVPYLANEFLALVLLVLCGIVAAGSITMAADLVSFTLFAGGVLAPVPIGLLQHGHGRFEWTSIALVFAFWGFTTLLQRRGYRALVDQLVASEALARSDAETKQERAFLDALFSSVPNAIIVTDRSGCVVAANPGFQDLFGFGAAEVIGRRVADVIVPPQLRDAARVVHERARGGETVIVETERVRKDGSHVTVQLSAAPVVGARDGAALFLYVDLTAERAIGEALRSMQRRLEQLVASSTAVIYATKVEGDVYTPSWVSDNLARITGYEVGEALDESWWLKHLHPEDRDRVLDELPALYEADHVMLEYRFRSKRGDYRWIHDDARLVRDGNGTPQEVFGAWLDITDRRAAEEATRHAREIAEHAAATRSAFLANMSHEIRTPMNAILGLSELLLDTELSAYQRRSLGLMRSAGETLLALLNDILDFSKLEADRLILEEIPFDLRYLLESTTSLLAVRIGDRPVELVADVAPTVPSRVRGDPTRLRQILTNLVGNAVKFTNEGEVVLIATLEGIEDARARVRFAVRDTGIGIPQAQLETIFDEFSQADTSTTRQYGGTGLGLSIAKRLVDMMGGCLTVKSDVGIGSEFSFIVTLPVDAEASATGAQAAALVGRRVIVVDDHTTNRRIVREMLQSAGMRVDEAAMADEGFGLMRDARDVGDPYDLAILDAQMPERSGFELTADVRGEAGIADVKLLMLTSAGQRGDTQRCRVLGMDGYLTKPVSRSDLLEMAATLLNPNAPPATETLVTRHSIAESRRRLRILLAEDNPINQEVAASMLRKRGHKVDIANNGREAVDAVEHQRYDLVLMDIQMPVLDGFAATKLIRAGTSQPLVPIVALTAHALTGERERCLANGMNGYVPKPFRPHELFTTVESFGDVVLADEAATVERPSIDIEGFRRTMREAGAEDAVDGILDMFVQHVPGRIAGLRAAVDAADAPAISSAAHAFKSPAAAIGALKLAGLLQEIELAAKSGIVEQASQAVGDVMLEAASVVEHLRVLRGVGAG